MIRFDPASFKDPAGRVFYHNGSVYRTLSRKALDQFEAARNAGLIDNLIGDGLLVDTKLVRAADVGLTVGVVGDAVLEQRRISLVTYSYEWSFEMLRDAALATLSVMERALDAGFILKDANAFNILFDGMTPKLVDVPSIETHQDGQPWAGYSQFCRSFLFPLLVSAYRDIDVQPLLRGSLGDLPLRQTAKLMALKDYGRGGVLHHILLPARLERMFAASAQQVQHAASDHYHPKAAIVTTVRGLRKLISGLRAPKPTSEWSSYGTCHSYSEDDHQAKKAFVGRVLGARRFTQVVDLGCNTGEYSRIALESGAQVLAIDLDARAIDRLYRDLPGSSRLTPIVASLLDPTPAMGWELQERRSLLDRIVSDGFLALALIHHLRITGGVPLKAILGQLFAIAPEGIIEWVGKEDPMVRHMLSLRPDVYDDYTWESFESSLREHAQILSVQPTHGGHRRLCHVRLVS
jgi:SAM-dependent methyltransferase